MKIKIKIKINKNTYISYIPPLLGPNPFKDKARGLDVFRSDQVRVNLALGPDQVRVNLALGPHNEG